jgi:YVTN family beta-propeller protein
MYLFLAGGTGLLADHFDFSEFERCGRMSVKKAAVFFLFFLFLSGCQALPTTVRPNLDTVGEIFLYAEPFPKEVAGLSFSLEGISAINEEGQEIPFSPSFQQLKAGEPGRQRLLAMAYLPPGSYRGFSFHVSAAALKSERGEAALAVPGSPVKVDYPFLVEKKNAYVVSLTLNQEPVKDGHFTPVFQVSVPQRPLSGLLGYVSNRGADAVMVFDKKKMEVSGAVVTGSDPGAIVVDEVNLKAYVAVSGEDAVALLDLLSGKIINRTALSPGDAPREIALTPDGRTLLTVNYGTNTVSFIDTSSLTEVQRVQVGFAPCSLLMDSAGRRAYVFNSRSNTVSVIDVASMAVVTTLPTETGPVRGQFNARGDRLYVIFSGSPYLDVIDLRTLSLLQRQYVGADACSIKVDPRTDLLYIGRKHDNAVAVYNPFTLIPSYYIRTRGSVSYMTIDAREGNLYLVIPERKTVSVVNLISRDVMGEMDVDDPFWVAMTGER